MIFKVLIAEDEHDLATVVTFGVRMMWPGSQVLVATTGREALDLFARERPDLVVLDVEMPAPDGFEVCHRIREQSDVPILMLTVRDATLDKVRAFDLGADDYLTKPFEHPELLARLRALARRARPGLQQDTPAFSAGDLSIDFDRQEVRVGGELVALTTLEFRLLRELVRHAGSVVSHRYLLEQVWGPQYLHDTRYLKVFIQRLRQKLGDNADTPKYIRTEWGTGYQFLLPR